MSSMSRPDGSVTCTSAFGDIQSKRQVEQARQVFLFEIKVNEFFHMYKDPQKHEDYNDRGISGSKVYLIEQ